MPGFRELVEHSAERQWRHAGVPDADIEISRRTGINGLDVRALREFGSRGYLIVVRCPNLAARSLHGVLPPKPMHVKSKTSAESGAVGTRAVLGAGGQTFAARPVVSDYDLMGIWQRKSSAWDKIHVSAANGAVRGPWLRSAMAIVRDLNSLLVSRIQHGCQDDFESSQNPGVNPGKDHFVAFWSGLARHLANTGECADFYAKQGLVWPYDAATGKYTGPTRA